MKASSDIFHPIHHYSLTSGVTGGGQVEGRLRQVVEHPRSHAVDLGGLPQQSAQAVELAELRRVVHNGVAPVTYVMTATSSDYAMFGFFAQLIHWPMRTEKKL